MSLKCKRMAWLSIIVEVALLAGRGEGAFTTIETEQTLTVIRDCLEESSPPWSEGWRSEYLEGIRETLNGYEEPYDYARRMDLLKRGFPSYWDSIKKDDDRSLFELQCAQIKWYVESLMAVDFPDEEERQVLPRQWKALWHEATDSLLSQFVFLDPNVARKAAADHLDRCRSGIETPLLPIFQRPFTAGQVEQIRSGWHEMRYARVDLMRQLGGEEVFMARPLAGETLSEHPHYQLTQRSLEQLESFLWTVVTRPPENYLQAWQDYRKAQQRHRQRVSWAQTQEGRLQSERSSQLHQTEYLSFLLAVVLESAQQLQNPSVNGVSTLHVENAPPKEVMPMR